MTYFQINRDNRYALYRVKIAIKNNSNDETDGKMTMIVALHQKPTWE
jgi:hypothetical protein